MDETKPDVAALTGGGFVVVWTRPDDTPGAAVTPGIGATVYNSTGTTAAKANIQVNASVAGAQHDASVTALKDGGFVVVWEDDALHQARGQRFNAAGTKIGTEFVLNTNATLNGTPFEPTSVTLLNDGRIAFAVNNATSGEVDVLTSIWDPRTSPIMGTNASENLTSRQNGASVFGLGGNDNILGFSGADRFDGGAGNDSLSAGIGNDILNGGAGNDNLNGGKGNDTFVIDSVRDVVQDSGGFDLVRSTVSKTLALGFEHLTLLGTQGLTGTGNASANTLTGNAANNRLSGLSGNDTMRGGAGNDVLIGGAGKDTLIGGAGTDDFDFNAVADMGRTAATRDVIVDFAVGDDIDLSTIDANGAAAGNTAFSFLAANGAAFTGVAGQLRWQKSGSFTLVEGDINGNKVADFQIQLSGSKSLTATDFIL